MLAAEVVARVLKPRVVGGGASSLPYCYSLLCIMQHFLKLRALGTRLPEASVWNLQDMQLDGMGDSMTRASAEDAGWCENPSGFPEQDTRNRSTSSKAKGCSNESGEPIWHPSVEGLLGEARAESGSLRRQRRPQRQSFLPTQCVLCQVLGV